MKNDHDTPVPVDEHIKRSLAEKPRFEKPRGRPLTPYNEHFLPDEVRTADLTKYSDAALEGRLAQYERDYTFEPDKCKRAEFKAEMQRTKTEINRRKMYRVEEALRVFEL